jgi:hypothetical protein
MTRGVRWYLLGSFILVALIALAGCSHYMWAEREPWRRDAEAACLNGGEVKESPTRVRISAIDGPGACGIAYPLRVSSLGDGGPLGYTDEAVVPLASIPDASMPRRWPVSPSGPGPASDSQSGAIQSGAIQSSPLPPAQPYGTTSQAAPPYRAPPQYVGPQYGRPSYGGPQYGAPQPSAPMSLTPPGVAPRDDEIEAQEREPPASYPPAPYPPAPYPPASYPPPSHPSYDVPRDPAPYGAEAPPLEPPRTPLITGSVEVKPAATLACPIVAALDQWIAVAVQPAAQRWFRQPVVEIKQISAYSCRGMNGDPNAHISEHAFGNALDIAEFTLADGRVVSVQYGWHGTPEEQGFLHDVQMAACQQFTTVLAPGANVYHYNHIHVDLMRHYSDRHICEPAAIPGAVAAERAQSHYAARHDEPGVTGSIGRRLRHVFGEDDDSLPNAVPGDD